MTGAEDLDRPDRIARLDPGGMGDRIEGFAAQLQAGREIAAPALERMEARRPRRVVLFGMGGSAIAGDLVRTLVDREGPAPFHVVRHYEPPVWLTPEDFLVFSSYSGETEETLAAYRATRGLGARSCVLSTGGTLVRLGEEDRHPIARLPAGHPPRAALGYSFSALAWVAGRLGLLSRVEDRLEAAAAGVEEVASACGRGVIQSRNPAKQLAIRLAGRAVILFANERTLGPVALRWKGQLNENSKHLAWASLLPEMNHNEVDSYVAPPEVVGRLGAIVLRDLGDPPRIQARLDWLERYMEGRGVPASRIQARGEEPMARALSTAVMGDFVSYYLALAHEHDPSSLPGVEALKRAMSG